MIALGWERVGGQSCMVVVEYFLVCQTVTCQMVCYRVIGWVSNVIGWLFSVIDWLLNDSGCVECMSLVGCRMSSACFSNGTGLVVDCHWLVVKYH